MNVRISHPDSFSPPRLRRNAVLTVTFLLAFAGMACKSANSHTSDVHLKAIDKMLDAQLPKGTSRARVNFFLNSRGYQQQSSSDGNTVVAIVHHVDTETLQPSTARVSFHFDSNDALTSYELEAASEVPLQP
jgi:hypothetical protein